MTPAAKRRVAADQSDRQTLAEWVVSGAAGLIVLAVVAALVVDAVRSQEPPAFRVAVQQVEARGGSYFVRVQAENFGEETAAAATVHAELQLPDGTVEEGDQMIDYLAGGERETVVFVFSNDPRDGELDVRVASYGEP